MFFPSPLQYVGWVPNNHDMCCFHNMFEHVVWATYAAEEDGLFAGQVYVVHMLHVDWLGGGQQVL
jgi:hypothetical protein